MLRASLAAAAVLFAGGCQNLIGIDDVESHLPRLDGEYLVGLERVRADGTTHDTLRFLGTTRLDDGKRELRLTLTLLEVGGAPAAEPFVFMLSFPEASTTAVLAMDFGIPSDAVATAITNSADGNLRADFTLRAEGDYAFCAEPTDGNAMFPSIGSKLRADASSPVPADPSMFDTDCDDL